VIVNWRITPLSASMTMEKELEVILLGGLALDADIEPLAARLEAKS
jgi:hypothetical protein